MADQEALGREYLLHEEIGRGALAVVRRATRRSGGPSLAAKLLRPEVAGDRRVRELFLREEAALRDLDHPGIVGLRDLVVEGGTLALVMDYVDGPDLRRHLIGRGGRLSVPETATIMAQVAGAVAAAHAQGVVHLDLKPENLLLVRDTDPPVARVTDFGVAVLLLDAERGVAGGTPGYTAPEIWHGAPPTAAADVYSLGVLLVELITGDIGGDPDVLPEELSGPARSCLAPEARRRPTARRLASYLRTLVDSGVLGEAPAAGPPTAAGSPFVAGAAAAAGAASAAGFSAVAGPSVAGPAAAGPAAAGPAAADAAGQTPVSRQTTLRGAGAAAAPAAGGTWQWPGAGSWAASGPVAAPPVAAPGAPDHVGLWAGQFGNGPPVEVRETPLRPGVTPPPQPPAAPPDGGGPRGWRRGPLVTLGVVLVIAAALIGANVYRSAHERAGRAANVAGVTSAPAVVTEPTAAAGQDPTLPTDPVATSAATTTPAAIRVTLAGYVEDDAGTLAMSIRDGKAIAYVCDGDKVEAWLRGTAQDGKLRLAGKGGTKIVGTFSARGAQGDLTILGKTHGFTLTTVKKPSGLYRASARVRGAKVAGSWIVLPDGRQVGVLTEGDEIGPAPRLDVTSRTTTVNGTEIEVGAIDADTGTGF
ncbi:serine/threonine-protein kinase [Actinoplanes oblitus]|uniref:Serine/threonine-protein kinase n=1 Tax=Actinoplanes oblitus TaxID=3040509 RepID=A0ABY8WNM6_9ACTN|nr:serine/threonine-protein kinase [Actinoplanes oblitus]WIM99082.1 serine/threonine-protein kinase [Actinoplanes oblitus]